MFDEGVDRVVGALHHATQPVKVVAIDGHSAAGTSTFAARVAERVPGTVVHGDDFYRVMDEDKRAAAKSGRRRCSVLRLAPLA